MATTVGLTLFKLVVAHLSGSVGVLSEGLHSSLDLVSAALAFFTVREAGKPADKEHPFGHGKIETLSSLFESVLLGVAAGFIVFEGIDHLRNPQPVQYQFLAMATILISMIVSYGVYLHNRAAADETDSSALRVNALHFLSDVVASAGILIGLVLLKATGRLFIDPLMAFAVAAYILMISARQVKEAILELSDTQLPESEVHLIEEILKTFRHRIIDAHDLRTRKSGATRHIDFHLSICGEMTVEASHRVCDEMEAGIQASFPHASVNIHVEPCDAHRSQCSLSCPIYVEKQKRILP